MSETDTPKLDRRPEWTALADHRKDALARPDLRELFADDPGGPSGTSCAWATCASTTPRTWSPTRR